MPKNKPSEEALALLWTGYNNCPGHGDLPIKIGDCCFCDRLAVEIDSLVDQKIIEAYLAGQRETLQEIQAWLRSDFSDGRDTVADEISRREWRNRAKK